MARQVKYLRYSFCACCGSEARFFALHRQTLALKYLVSDALSCSTNGHLIPMAPHSLPGERLDLVLVPQRQPETDVGAG